MENINIKFHLLEDDENYEITDIEMFKKNLEEKPELENYLIESITERLAIDEAVLSLIEDKIVSITNPNRSEKPNTGLKKDIEDNRQFLKSFGKETNVENCKLTAD